MHISSVDFAARSRKRSDEKFLNCREAPVTRVTCSESWYGKRKMGTAELERRSPEDEGFKGDPYYGVPLIF